LLALGSIHLVPFSHPLFGCFVYWRLVGFPQFCFGWILVCSTSAHSSKYRLCNINYVQPIECN
jgi:hypothetical protein